MSTTDGTNNDNSTINTTSTASSTPQSIDKTKIVYFMYALFLIVTLGLIIKSFYYWYHSQDYESTSIGLFNALYVIYFVITFTYLFDYANESGSMACIQTDLQWIVWTTFFIGLITMMILPYMYSTYESNKKSAVPNAFIMKFLMIILFILGIVSTIVNFFMIFPRAVSGKDETTDNTVKTEEELINEGQESTNILDLNPLTQCYLPFTVPVITLNFLGLVVLSYLWFS